MESCSQGEMTQRHAAGLWLLPCSGLTEMCLCSDSDSSGTDMKVKSKQHVPAATGSDHREIGRYFEHQSPKLALDAKSHSGLLPVHSLTRIILWMGLHPCLWQRGNEAMNKPGVKISTGSIPPVQLCVALASLQEEVAACTKPPSFSNPIKSLAPWLPPMLGQS